MDTITTQGTLFLDQFGRQRIFHGINLVYKGEKQPDGRLNYFAPWSDDDFGKLASLGFNVVRLGMIWDAVEPHPGIYGNTYLEWIRQMLDLCAKHDMYAFLDMHQDLYSSLFSDGAPAWATLTEEPFEGTALWSDAYLLSPAVQQALDAFWQNRPAAGGVGLMDRYAAMWQHVIRQLGSHEAVLGFDFMNEPNPGSASVETFGLLIESFTSLRSQAEDRDVSIEEMQAAFSDPIQKMEMLRLLEDKELYLALAQACQQPVKAFDQGALHTFYEKMAASLRAVMPQGIIFRENSYFSNMGIRCAALPIGNSTGREPLQAYAPHGYDLVVDTEAIGMASNNRVDVIFSQHRKTQEELDVPVLVGEWGAFGCNDGILDHAAHLLDLFEQWQWSDTYWCYHPAFFTEPALSLLHRSYPQAVAGKLDHYHCDCAQRTFAMQWQDNAGSRMPTVVSLHARPKRIELAGTYSVQENRLVIPPAGGQRSLLIEFEREGNQ